MNKGQILVEETARLSMVSVSTLTRSKQPANWVIQKRQVGMAAGQILGMPRGEIGEAFGLGAASVTLASTRVRQHGLRGRAQRIAIAVSDRIKANAPAKPPVKRGKPIHRLIEAAAEVTGVSSVELAGKSNRQAVAHPRFIAMLAGKYCGMTCTYLNWVFNKDHSTILYGWGRAVENGGEHQAATIALIYLHGQLAINIKTSPGEEFPQLRKQIADARKLAPDYVPPPEPVPEAVKPEPVVVAFKPRPKAVQQSRRPVAPKAAWDTCPVVAAKRAAVQARIG